MIERRRFLKNLFIGTGIIGTAVAAPAAAVAANQAINRNPIGRSASGTRCGFTEERTIHGPCEIIDIMIGPASTPCDLTFIHDWVDGDGNTALFPIGLNYRASYRYAAIEPLRIPRGVSVTLRSRLITLRSGFSSSDALDYKFAVAIQTRPISQYR